MKKSFFEDIPADSDVVRADAPINEPGAGVLSRVRHHIIRTADPAFGYWQFNWKTPKSYADSCRVMVVEFNSGALSPAAKFKFKK